MLLPSALGREARADEATWGGPYFLHMHAGGGWDPTMLCDAKVTAGGATPVYENRLTTAVEEINGIFVPTEAADGKYLLHSQTNAVEDPAHFFKTVGKNVLVFNGLDTQTNNHDTGVQGLACGNNDVELPALAALFAGYVSAQRNVPMAFLAGGQYNRTGDVVSASRFAADKIPLIADPFRGAPNDDNPIINDFATQRMIQARNERLARVDSTVTLPRTKRTFGAWKDATKGGASVNLLKAVAGATPPAFDTFAANLAPDTIPFLSQVNNGTSRFVDLGRPLEIVLQCFKAGVSASATFSQGGFDTHSNHDVDQANAMGQFLARLRYTILRAEQLGLTDKLFIMVTSDFGRTPKYNTGNGKDHWNVTSALVAGPGIRGGRAVGKSDEGHKSMKISPTSPDQVLADKDANGVRIHSGHMHRSLRTALGIDGASFIGQFALPAADKAIPLLT